MLMLRDLSDLTKLEDFTVSIKAIDDTMQQYDHMSANMLYASFALANIYPFDWLENKVKALHRSLFKRMHDELKKAMLEVARGKDLEELFATVALIYAYRALANSFSAGALGGRVKAVPRRQSDLIRHTDHLKSLTDTPRRLVTSSIF